MYLTYLRAAGTTDEVGIHVHSRCVVDSPGVELWSLVAFIALPLAIMQVHSRSADGS
jgi:hypothetical protein